MCIAHILAGGQYPANIPPGGGGGGAAGGGGGPKGRRFFTFGLDSKASDEDANRPENDACDVEAHLAPEHHVVVHDSLDAGIRNVAAIAELFLQECDGIRQDECLTQVLARLAW